MIVYAQAHFFFFLFLIMVSFQDTSGYIHLLSSVNVLGLWFLKSSDISILFFLTVLDQIGILSWLSPVYNYHLFFIDVEGP